MSETSSTPTLNGLLNGEVHAAHLYWQAGAWCDARHLSGCAEFLITHAAEELTHMERILRYMMDNDHEVVFSALPAPTIEAQSVLELFKFILAHEGTVTSAVGAAVKASQTNGDHGTFEFLQWFVMEQRGEMKLFRHIVDRIALIGDGPHSLFLIDQEVQTISKQASAQASPGPGF